jgi:alpha 1,2-mannosyltransferase
MSYKVNGWRELDFTIDDIVTANIRKELITYSERIESYPATFFGRGIVFCAGGLSYFTCVWISIKRLREIGCKLPIEVWYLGNELSTSVIDQLLQFDVKCCNFLENKEYSSFKLKGFGLKPLSIRFSTFEEVLFLDADNLAMIDPTFLFEDLMYKSLGTIFWPDMWRTSQDNPIWKVIDSDRYDDNEQESGQILINKRLCWEELNICLYLNSQRNIYYRFLYGDKDTFKFAWLFKKRDYYMIPGFPGVCGYLYNTNFIGNTLVQYSPGGLVLFFHRNLLKWDVTLYHEVSWTLIKRFKNVSDQSKFFFSVCSNSHFCLDIAGDIEIDDIKLLAPDIERRCIDDLIQLRNEKFYLDFVHHLHLRQNRFKDALFQKIT